MDSFGGSLGVKAVLLNVTAQGKKNGRSEYYLSQTHGFQ